MPRRFSADFGDETGARALLKIEAFNFYPVLRGHIFSQYSQKTKETIERSTKRQILAYSPTYVIGLFKTKL